MATNRFIPKAELDSLLQKAKSNNLRVDEVVQDLVNKNYVIEGLNDAPKKKKQSFFQGIVDRTQQPSIATPSIQPTGQRPLEALRENIRALPGQALEATKAGLPAAGSITGGIVGGIAGAPGGPIGIGAGMVAGAAGGRA